MQKEFVSGGVIRRGFAVRKREKLSAGPVTVRAVRYHLGLALATLSTALVAAKFPPSEASEEAGSKQALHRTSAWETIKSESFELVWSTVNEGYFDPAFGGVDWAGMPAKYAGELAAAEDELSLRGVLQRLVSEIGQSHFAIIPHEVTVFRPEERERVGTIGVRSNVNEGLVLVQSVVEGSPASGLVKPGDVIVAIEGHAVEAWVEQMEVAGVSPQKRDGFLRSWVESWLAAPVGTPVRLSLRDPSGEHREVQLQAAEHDGPWAKPVGNFPSQPLEIETVRDRPPQPAYLRFNSFSPHLMAQIRRFLTNLEAEQGLVLDLRGNPGGLTQMASGIAGLLLSYPDSLGEMQLRQGHLSVPVFPQASAYTGPLAVLIDGGSASTSEILAAGLQDLARARLFGQTSAGAALPSSFKRLPTGDLFQFAIADLRRPNGASIEGFGVEPDEVVQADPQDLQAGRDPVREAAEDWIAHQLRHGADAGN